METRTPLVWISIILLSHVFCFCLACQTKHIDHPGIKIRPREEHNDSPLVNFIRGEYGYNATYRAWDKNTKQLSEYLSPYYELEERYHNGDDHVKECTYGSDRPLDGQICSQNMNALTGGTCNQEDHFGYLMGTPCFLINLDKIIDWRPDPMDLSFIDKRSWIPDTIRDAMHENHKGYEDNLNDRVWIECHGMDPADKENLGPVTYYPEMGVPTAWFPYRNQPDYLSPLMFIELGAPTGGVLISVECVAWARNLVHGKENLAVGYFQVMFD